MPKTAKKTVPKPFNTGQWTEARMRSFAMSALRRASWPVKYEAVKRAYVRDGTNPETGRKCKLHRCACCGSLFPQSKMFADHIDPVIPINGFSGNNLHLGYDWAKVIQRLYCEVDNYQALCKDCHDVKSQSERQQRKFAKGIAKSKEV